ncbi:MAG TPA: hypothetical protein VFN48_04900 [Solirubrobacteraceae bacterium]|nr:hypothetical protein [Solirubrobacteraceae bacterium]
MEVGGWELAASPPGAWSDPAAVPAAAWASVGRGRPVAAIHRELSAAEIDGRDWWYRAALPADGGERLVLESVATLAEIFLDGVVVARSETMFRPVTLAPAGARELVVACRALGPVLARPRRPRARWRTRLVRDGGLRFHRTMLLGRTPGIAPEAPAVGLCAPVRLESAGVTGAVRPLTRMDGERGVLELRDVPPSLHGAEIRLSGPTGEHRGRVGEILEVPGVARWWPHTHGTPELYALSVAGTRLGRVGFRTLGWPADWERDGFGLSVNGVEIFCRGAVWTPPDVRELATLEDAVARLRRRLEIVVDAGMNMLRVPGIATYESTAFHTLCDELGILVWQDMMFANLDYPEADAAFCAEVAAEAAHQGARLAGHPSLAVLCGGSEVAQQVGMLGLEPALARGALFTQILPAGLAAAGADAPYIPNTPWGAGLAFRPDTGVTNYYGVGAYRQDLAAARLDRVAFSAESLALANVGDRDELLSAGVPRDGGAGWDFADVRDHYLEQLFGIDPRALRWVDPARYGELSRAVSGELMAGAFGAWRAGDSPTRGALVLWLADLEPGSGWGLLDDRGVPKAVLGRLARVLAPRAVWLTLEGLRGVAVHVANDRPDTLAGELTLRVLRDGAVPVAEASVPVTLAGHGVWQADVETLLGRFLDLSWTYRFGPAAADLVVATLRDADGCRLGQATAFPVGRGLTPQRAAELGLSAQLTHTDPERITVQLSCARAVLGLRLYREGWRAAEDLFDLVPGEDRAVTLVRESPADGPGPGRDSTEVAPAPLRLSALNLQGTLQVR